MSLFYRCGVLGGIVAIVFGCGCDERKQPEQDVPAVQPAVQKHANATDPEPPPPQRKEKTVAVECPEGMASVPGGEFWVGTEREVYDREENPRFRARVSAFCVDRYEVSTSEYERCQASGKCSPPHGGSKTCNTVAKGKGAHPINCIDHSQARAVCEARDARLLTEIEWEYIARGGKEMREFPWGDAHPDDHTCWKHPGTCERGKYAEGAFGLHDVVGNVWEWTDSWFGRYPWPVQTGRHRVYRGGSWSRRFVKWMRPTLRNRLDPEKSGSHLGVRCAKTLKGTECAGGPTESGGCHHAILEVKCLDEMLWNGARCAREGDERRCLPPATEEPGYGCVRPKIVGVVEQELDTQDVKRSRSPEFDADCVANSPGRPVAYRYTGGGHLARNVVGKKHGCKNRDVGVGFNSACCPN